MNDEVYLNKSTIQARDDFLELLKKQWFQAKKLLKTYSKDDIRPDFFTLLSESNLWLLIGLDTFLEMLNPNDVKISNYMKLNPKSRLQYLDQHDTINKIGYISQTMFVVEEFIKNIMRGMKKPPKRGKYYYFTEDCLNSLDIFDEQKHRILNAPYQLRDSLHNNGYVYNDFEITLREKNYKFVKGERIEFASWETIYIFFDELSSTLIEIVENEKLQEFTFIPHTNIGET